MLETGFLSLAVIGMGYERDIANISRISQSCLNQRLAPMPVVSAAGHFWYSGNALLAMLVLLTPRSELTSVERPAFYAPGTKQAHRSTT